MQYILSRTACEWYSKNTFYGRKIDIGKCGVWVKGSHTEEVERIDEVTL